MGCWKDNNLSGVMEYPFDFERYIEERLREIEDKEEREFAKRILLDGMSRLIESTEVKYQQLERKVYTDLRKGTNHYETVMTIVGRDCYDPNNLTLYPIIEADLNERNLKQSLSQECEIWIGTIFLKMNEEKIRKFRNSEYLCSFAKTDGGKEKIFYQIRPATRYRNMIEMLYQMFLDNHVAWETIHTGYLDKFFDIYVIPDENFTKTNGPGRIVREKFYRNLFLNDINLSMGEYEEYTCYNVIPFWNIEWISFKNESFMVPHVDDIFYEHTFQPERQSIMASYLIQKNEDIWGIFHQKDKVIIKSTKENFENWKAVRIIQVETKRSKSYTAPFLTNRKRDSFIRRYAERKGAIVLTKLGLFRKIMEMDIRDYIEVVDYAISENLEEYPVIEGMNWFVHDEFFPMDGRRILLLCFKESQPGHYLNDSIVRFVISQMQLEINEYRLIGKII